MMFEKILHPLFRSSLPFGRQINKIHILFCVLQILDSILTQTPQANQDALFIFPRSFRLFAFAVANFLPTPVGWVEVVISLFL